MFRNNSHACDLVYSSNIEVLEAAVIIDVPDVDEVARADEESWVSCLIWIIRRLLVR